MMQDNPLNFPKQDSINESSLKKIIKTVNVAVAVLFYKDNYLLGYRHQSQHQGDRYEFVGGKVEPDEQAKQALIREVYEEVGLDIADNVHQLLGVIEHDYEVTELKQNNQGIDTNDNSGVKSSDNDSQNGTSKKREPTMVKRVVLHVYQIELSWQQYEDFAQVSVGCEGQMLKWVERCDLLNNRYQLPDANTRILQWLQSQ